MRSSVSRSLILLEVQSVVRDPGRDGMRLLGDKDICDIVPEPSAHTIRRYGSRKLRLPSFMLFENLPEPLNPEFGSAL